MIIGSLLRVDDALLLFKVSCLLSQAVFALGLYLLARKLFAHTVTIWLFCLGGILTNSWLFNFGNNFGIFYVIPLFYFCVLEFIESRKPRYLWFAGLLELLSLSSPVIYVAPLHLLAFLAFLLPVLVRQPSLVREVFRFRTFFNPFFGAFAALGGALAVWGSGWDFDLLSPDRDPVTGHVTLQGFLITYRSSLAGRFTALIFGHIAQGDKTNFVGVVLLLLAGYALLQRRDTPFLAFATASVALLWFGIGGWFSTACYFLVPGMKIFRHLEIAFNLLKVFLLILGGFGFETLLRDIKRWSPVRSAGSAGAPAPGMPAYRTMSWNKGLVVALCLCFALDLWINSRPGDLVLRPVDKSRVEEEDTFVTTPNARPVLLVRFLFPAACFTACLVVVCVPGPRSGVVLLGSVLKLPFYLSRLTLEDFFDHGNHPERDVVNGQLFIASSERSTFFVPANDLFNSAPLSIACFVEG